MELIAGGDVNFAADSEMFGGAMVAGGRITLAGKISLLNTDYQTRFQNEEGDTTIMMLAS